MRSIVPLLVLACACTPQPPTPTGTATYPYVSPSSPPFRGQERDDRLQPTTQKRPTLRSKKTPATPLTSTPSRTVDWQRLPAQDVVYYRFIDKLGTATISAPQGRLGAVRGSKRFFLNPHSQLDKAITWRNIRYGIWDSRFGRVDMRSSVRLGVPSRIRYRVKLLPQSRIAFAILVPGAARKRRVRLSVRVRGEVVFAQEYAPMRFPPVRDWVEEEFPLDGVAPGVADIEIRASWSAGLPATENAEVLLADPVLLTRVGHNSPHRQQVEAIIGKGKPFNVIYIVVDALRSDVLDPQRRPFAGLTPVMDDLLQSGTAFHNAFGNSNQTRSSTVVMLSGRYLAALGLTTPWWIINPRLKNQFYLQRPPLLPLRLREHGYVTRAIANNQFIFGNLYLGLDLGFDAATDFREATRDTVHITETSENFIRRNRHKRFFLFINYNAPHTPYLPPEKYRRIVDAVTGTQPMLLHRNYLGEIAYTDEYLGRIFRLLDALDLRRRTLVIFTADHGEIMNRKHACRSVRFYAPCHYSHGLTFYDEELNVPLAISLPGVIKSGNVVRMPVTHVDVPPTVMEVLGLPIPQRYDGKSLLPYLRGVLESKPRLVFAEGRTGWAVRWSGYKYIHHNWASDFQTPSQLTAGKLVRSELYRLDVDPREELNLVSQQPQLAAQMKRQLFGFQAQLAQRGKRQFLARLNGDLRPSPTKKPRRVTTKSTAIKKPLVKKLAQVTLPPVTHFLVFNGDKRRSHRFEGTLQTTGRFLLPKTKPGTTPTCTVKQDKTLVCSVVLTGTATRIQFKTAPPQAPITIGITLDGRALGRGQIFVGPNGIALLSEQRTIDTDRLQRFSVAGKRGPRFLIGDDLGLFYWRDSYVDPETAKPIVVPKEHQDDSLDRNMSNKMRKLLRDMGYAK